LREVRRWGARKTSTDRARDRTPLYDRARVNMTVIVVVIVALIVVVALLAALASERHDRRALSARLVAQRRDVDERAALERAKSEFLATASHELRSPLTSVKGFVELLENGTRDGRFTEREREFVEIIGRSTDRLVELVDELLEVARLDADRVRLDRRPIDVGEAIQEVAELLGPQIRDKDQRLGIYVAPTLPLADADAGRVRQVIGNLLTNAHLYTPSGGRIHVGAEADRAWVRIVVADSGVGMTQDEAAHVFDRFYRAASGSAAAAGTGLGLSIVQSLVALHGGEVGVASRPGAGTTFHVRLPVARLPSDDALELVRGRRVLVAAGPAAGEAVASALTLLEAETRRVDDPDQALIALTAEHHDVLVLAAGGSDDGGRALAVAERIRGDAELHGTPIVFLGAGDDARLSGEWAVATPPDPRELRAVLAAALRTGRSRVLVVGRAELQEVLEPALDDLGIEYEWEHSGTSAARACGERRFELALVDAGMRNPDAVLEALALSGRRLRRAVILFSEDGRGETVAVHDAPGAVIAALRGDRATTRPDEKVLDGAHRRR
jgi:signal transduction histidine kinase/DNA-binding response OmpR family regulator